MFETLKNEPYLLLQDVANFLGVSTTETQKIVVSWENPGGAPQGAIKRIGYKLRNRLRGWGRFVPTGWKRWVDSRLLERNAFPDLSPQILAHLRQIFEPDVTSLETLLGYPLPELRKRW
jgi:hypothetical protein